MPRVATEPPATSVASGAPEWAVPAQEQLAAGWQPQAPIDLPRRPVPTAELLYEEAVAAEPWRFQLPGGEAAQIESEPVAGHVLEIADQVDDVRRGVVERDHGAQMAIRKRILEALLEGFRVEGRTQRSRLRGVGDRGISVPGRGSHEGPC